MKHQNRLVKSQTQTNSDQNILISMNRSVSNIERCSIESGKNAAEKELTMNPANEKKKPRNVNIKLPVLPPRDNVNAAMMLQTETNNLLKHIISQNNKHIQLLTKLLEK